MHSPSCQAAQRLLRETGRSLKVAVQTHKMSFTPSDALHVAEVYAKVASAHCPGCLSVPSRLTKEAF